MLRITKLLVSTLVAASLGAGCGDNHDVPPDASVPAPPDGGGAGQDPTDPAGFTTPQGEKLAFGVKEGNIRNYFHRQGTAAVHLLTRSGPDPRIIAAYPAGNQGIGVWFDAESDTTELWADATAGSTDDAAVIAGGGVTAVVREEGEKDMHGVRATIQSDADRLTAYLTLLANVRTLRDFGYGLCLENASQFPELRNETVEYIAEHNVVRVRRTQIGGDYAMELPDQGRPGHHAGGQGAGVRGPRQLPGHGRQRHRVADRDLGRGRCAVRHHRPEQRRAADPDREDRPPHRGHRQQLRAQRAGVPELRREAAGRLVALPHLLRPRHAAVGAHADARPRARRGRGRADRGDRAHQPEGGRARSVLHVHHRGRRRRARGGAGRLRRVEERRARSQAGRCARCPLRLQDDR